MKTISFSPQFGHSFTVGDSLKISRLYGDRQESRLSRLTTLIKCPRIDIIVAVEGCTVTTEEMKMTWREYFSALFNIVFR